MNDARLSSWKILLALSLPILIAISGTLVEPVFADGSVTLLPSDTEGCFDLEGYGVPMHTDGEGTVTVDPPGAIVGAFIEWVGVEDTTPSGETTSTLSINGTEVVGNLAEGDAGISTAISPPWYSWWANIGPAGGPFGGLGIVDDDNTTLNITGWDGIQDDTGRVKTNGATVTVIYDTGADDDPTTEDCSIQNTIQILSGVDWYWYGTHNHHNTELLIFTFPTASIEREFSVRISHAGTTAEQTNCRGGAVWMLAGSGEAPTPTEFDILNVAEDGRGYGINGGVEIVDDPFTGPTLPCTPAVNPTPDHPYDPDQMCNEGAATCPYRGTAIIPPEGGNLGPEWGVIAIEGIVPDGTTWIAFQLESEEDQQGESGSWGVASLVIPSAGPNAVTLAGTDIASSGSNFAQRNALVAVLVAGALLLGVVVIRQRRHNDNE